MSPTSDSSDRYAGGFGGYDPQATGEIDSDVRGEILRQAGREPVTRAAQPLTAYGPQPAAGMTHYVRQTDIDPRAARRAERQVSIMFGLSALATVGFMIAYVVLPADSLVALPFFGRTSASNLALGLSLGLAIFLIGAGAIHWAKKLMPDVELSQERHPMLPDEQTRADALGQVVEGGLESGITRRPLLRRTLLAAMALLPLPAIVMLRDLGPAPKGELFRTMWSDGRRILADITYQPLRPEDIPVGAMVSAVPEGIVEVTHETGTLNERAKAPVVLVRMAPEDIRSQQGQGWDYQGILAYSKICTHVGCPIALYQQRTKHLLCPCHQSTFDLADSGVPIFGPAARRLPQLAISVDSEGYLVALGDFAEPVGPTIWERE